MCVIYFFSVELAVSSYSGHRVLHTPHTLTSTEVHRYFVGVDAHEAVAAAIDGGALAGYVAWHLSKEGIS